MSQGMGIDVGGTGIKGAVVDLGTGDLATKRVKLPTPQPATPEAVAQVVAEVVHNCGWEGPVGCGLPGVVRSSVVSVAPHLDESWLGINSIDLLSETLGLPVITLNDADAAGFAEMSFGAGQGCGGTVLLLTFGTGIGSALFIDGVLLPNTELGHLEMWGGDAEDRVSAKARLAAGLSWSDWAELISEYLGKLEDLISPDLIIVGGGVSRRHEVFVPLLRARADIAPAQLQNNAGIVGAALAASRKFG